MSGFFWNIRGFNKSIKHSVVRDWIKQGAFQFGCVLETRVKESKSMQITSSVFRNWSFISNYEYSRRGRIWEVWGPKVRVTPCFKSGQVITCSVLLEGMVDEIFCSFIYASNSMEERKELWEDLKNHKNSPMFRNKPWLVFGDFNEILDVEEHSGFEDNQSHPSGMGDFQDMAHYCSLMDMAMQGPRLTWCNKRDNGLICKKMDCTLMNDTWLQTFPQSYSVFEAGGCSDHLRCRIMIQPGQMRPRKPFKFTNALADVPGFIPLVEKFWEETEPIFHSTSALYRFSKKLKDLKPLLRGLRK